MKRTLALAGVLLSLLPAAASAQQRQNLYEIFRKQTNLEYAAAQQFDDVVIQYLQGVYRDRWTLSTDEVKAALQQKAWAACAGDGAQQQASECARALENIPQLAQEEQRLRSFGRDLLRVASAQELPLSEIPGRPFHLATDLSGIVNIWRAGTGSVKSATGGVLVRTKALTDEQVEELTPKFEGIARRLSGESAEWRTAAVWHFQYGARLLAGQRNPDYPPPLRDDQSGPDTERQYMFLDDWLGLDQTLLEIWELLPKNRDDFDPPLSDNEAAYILFPDSLTDMLPENVLVWARVGGGAYEPGVGENNALGDVGLAWKYPVEPHLPSLLSIDTARAGDPVLGGRFPPEPAYEASSDENGNPLPAGETKAPIDGRGLCSMALAQRGYLCRPMRLTSEERCPEPESGGEDAITLVSCTTETGATLTVAGADVCEEIDWRLPDGGDAERCAVDPGIQSEYQLVKAQQRCVMGTDDPYAGKTEEEQDALCCRLEGEAHLVECKALAGGDVLRDEDGNPLTIDGVPVTPQICMEVRRLESCASALGREVRCPVTAAMIGAEDAVTIDGNVAPAEDPQKPLRIAARVRAIERYAPVCMPGTESAYKNTIGNNACYVGRCVEESLELRRLTAGRSPVSVGDGAFPYDDPEMGDTLADVLRSVPATNPPLPSYRPQEVTRVLEDALCQLQGLPAATPPHLCAFAPSRRLAVPLADGAATARSISYNAEEQREATLLVEQLSNGLGSRIGTDMQGQYLRIGTRTLSEVVALANTLLSEALTVTFPTDMCPLNIP